MVLDCSSWFKMMPAGSMVLVGFRSFSMVSNGFIWLVPWFQIVPWFQLVPDGSVVPGGSKEMVPKDCTFNSLRFNSDQRQISLCNINAFSFSFSRNMDSVGRLRTSPRLCYN